MVGKMWYKFCHIVAGWTCRTAWERKSEKKRKKFFEGLDKLDGMW